MPTLVEIGLVHMASARKIFKYFTMDGRWRTPSDEKCSHDLLGQAR